MELFDPAQVTEVRHGCALDGEYLSTDEGTAPNVWQVLVVSYPTSANELVRGTLCLKNRQGFPRA